MKRSKSKTSSTSSRQATGKTPAKRRVAATEKAKKAKKATFRREVPKLPQLLKRIEALEEQVDAQRARELARPSAHAATPAAARAATDRFIRDTTDGWLVVLIAAARQSLPSGLKVQFKSTTSGRDYGKVLEGAHEGADFDVTAGHLLNAFRRLSSARLRLVRHPGRPRRIENVDYDLDLFIDYVDDNANVAAGPFAALTDPANPVPNSNYVVQIPDFPHALGSAYGAHGTTWFRIGRSGDRYVHPGRISAGCITCAPSQWEAIYQILRCARTGDTETVAVLNVAL